jgi:putative tricarboxylic transport membrane protein
MKDRILSVVVGVGALGYLYADWRMPRVQLGDPLGPRAFPALVGVLLLISAVLLMLEARRRQPTPAAAPVAAAEPRRSSHVPLLIGVLVWTTCYYAAFEPAGYIIATIVYLFGLLCVFNKGQHKSNVLIAAGFTAVAYGIFSQLLNVQLPRGPFSF